MKKRSIFTGIIVALLTMVFTVQACFAWPSTGFREEKGRIFDDWNICRTSPVGENGFLQIKETRTRTSFRPLIILESLGEYSDIAYELGEQFAKKYPDRTQRAQKIFEYVRDGLRYVHDIDVFDMGEYAQNADEIANALREKGEASADCEEHALLLAVMYLGAGYRVGITLSPGHLAVVLYMPEYERANEVFTLSGDRGWIWLEATGNTNTFGWFPKGMVETPILGYEVSLDEHLPLYEPRPPVLAPIGDKEVNEDEMLRFTVSATDANDDDLTYSVTNLPEGASFDSNTRTFSWTPDKPGTHRGIRFEVSDGTLTDYEDITITVLLVNKPPVLAPIGDREVDEDELLRFTVSATDANNDDLTYSAANLPEGASFNANTRTFSWTPDEAGIYPAIHFEVSDGVLTDSEDITVIVIETGNPALVIIVIVAVVLVVAVVAVVILRRKARHA